MFSVDALSALPLATTIGSVYGGVAGESARASEQVTATQIAFGGIIETSARISDSVSVAPRFNAVIQENARTATVRYVGGGYAAGSYASGPFSALGRRVREISGDVISVQLTASELMQEAAQAQEIIRNTGIQNIPFSDGVSISDTTGIYLTVNRSVSETASVADPIIATPTYFGAIFESARAVTIRDVGAGYASGSYASGPFGALGDEIREVSGDQVYASANFATATAENSVLSDLFATKIEFTVDLSESAFLNEETAAQMLISINMAENLAISDPVTARAQWELIDTDEVTDWILVNTSKPN